MAEERPAIYTSSMHFERAYSTPRSASASYYIDTTGSVVTNGIHNKYSTVRYIYNTGANLVP